MRVGMVGSQPIPRRECCYRYFMRRLYLIVWKMEQINSPARPPPFSKEALRGKLSLNSRGWIHVAVCSTFLEYYSYY